MNNVHLDAELMGMGFLSPQHIITVSPSLNCETVSLGVALYRYDGTTFGLKLSVYEIVRKTPKGVWKKDWDKVRFVLSDARKRFAYPTKAEAITSFAYRKSAQLKILRSQTNDVEKWLDFAKQLKGTMI